LKFRGDVQRANPFARYFYFERVDLYPARAIDTNHRPVPRAVR
jgi:hypothetical protein